MNHEVKWFIERETVFGRLTCVSDTCQFRVECPECSPEQLGLVGEECMECDGILVRSDHCNAAEWIENGGDVADAYGGIDGPLRSGPVIVEWDGETYLWHYPEPAVVVVDKPDWA